MNAWGFYLTESLEEPKGNLQQPGEIPLLGDARSWTVQRAQPPGYSVPLISSFNWFNLACRSMLNKPQQDVVRTLLRLLCRQQPPAFSGLLQSQQQHPKERRTFCASQECLFKPSWSHAAERQDVQRVKQLTFPLHFATGHNEFDVIKNHLGGKVWMDPTALLNF